MQSRATVSTVLDDIGIGADHIAACSPLTGGTYNAVTRVTLTDGRDWVVKIPPPPTAAGMSYERDLLVNEVTFYAAAAATGDVAVPGVVHSRLDPGSATGPYLIMSACPGQPWYGISPALADREERRLRHELGRLVGRLHSVTGPGGFGYPAQALGPLAPTWRQAFTAMTDAVLADADTYSARLPRPTDRIRALLAAAAPVLDDVIRPALVHFDLWQGNLLVDGEPGARTIGGIIDGEPGARTIGGIIDGERMFWGDPAADFVSLALLGEVEKDEDLLAGYASSAADGAVVFDSSLRLRLALYRCYLYLIMLVETVPRRSPAEVREWVRREVGPQLESALVDVESALRTRE
ncbi:phosphotransferase family protein [Streptomyces sp. NBC_00154]|uniref:phosphotransferase family protein n=1 Tax=Streptomyces sp. NBC_00154 TaxID=2975670 RepID=UPI00224CD7B0|nr:aminoglycoside phosphotransferase family protein [Streptomyces sp. NBC_00154]MCX5311662.1 aminoglycoside phosphotransferase family protein [Streptomyces sp. NBC_00154]